MSGLWVIQNMNMHPGVLRKSPRAIVSYSSTHSTALGNITKTVRVCTKTGQHFAVYRAIAAFCSARPGKKCIVLVRNKSTWTSNNGTCICMRFTNWNYMYAGIRFPFPALLVAFLFEKTKLRRKSFAALARSWMRFSNITLLVLWPKNPKR